MTPPNYSMLRVIVACLSILGIAAWQQHVRADDAQPANASRDADAKVAAATIDGNGFRVHRVESSYQEGTTTISVLLPSSMQAGRKYRMLYVLPVEARDGTIWGKALDEVKRLKLHDKHQLICVMPSFSQVPWYADHPTNSRIRQESYFVNVVVPFIEREYPALAEPRGRLLVGFSKSGWGAFTLLLRHPETFGKAAAWDAPFGTEKIDRFQIGEVFGTQENFEKYRVATLLQRQSKKLGDKPRLVLAGANAFTAEHEAAHALLSTLNIPHVYFEGPKYKHAWEGGWLAKAVELLVQEGR